MNKKTILIVVAVLAVVLIGIVALVGQKRESAPGKYDQFAQCLTEKGMKFYGAFWCPHCQAMKKLFGNSTKYLNYIECSNTDGSQNQKCQDAKIDSYPTWEFTDGSRLISEQPLSALGEKAGCPLTESSPSAEPTTTGSSPAIKPAQ